MIVSQERSPLTPIPSPARGEGSVVREMVCRHFPEIR